MLVADRKETRYLGVPPQLQALRILIKQSYRVIDSVDIVQTLPYLIERRSDSEFGSHKLGYALPRKRGETT